MSDSTNRVKNLGEWENELGSRLGSAPLLGAIGLDEKETRRILECVGGALKRDGLDRGLRTMTQGFPRTFSCALVFYGAHSYDEGTYWPGLLEALQLEPLTKYEATLGTALKTALRRLDLRSEFPGHRYIGTILGHVGIPVSSLPTFFHLLLVPSVLRRRDVPPTASALIAEWLESPALPLLQKPGQRYLRYGGPSAEEFVQSCGEMAWEYLSTWNPPSAHPCTLPGYVVEAFEKYVNDGELTRQHQGMLKRPYLALAPWDLGIHLVLPAQDLCATGLSEALWRVTAVTERGVCVQDFPLYDHQEELVPFAEAFEEVRVDLLCEGSTLRSWTVDLAGGAEPVALFDAATGKHISGWSTIPRQALWVLVPRPCTVTAEPADQATVECLPQLPGTWSRAWHAVGFDLKRARALRVSTASDVRKIPVDASGAGPDIYLVGGDCIAEGATPGPFYVGRPPSLRIATASPDKDLRLAIRSIGETTPDPLAEFSLEDLVSSSLVARDAVAVHLESPQLLGARPMGAYAVSLEAPGTRTSLPFCVLPDCGLALAPLHLPDSETGSVPVTFSVDLPASTSLALGQRSARAGCTIERGNEARKRTRHVLTVPRETREVELVFSDLSSAQHTQVLTVTLPVNRPRWRLVSSASGSSDWTNIPLRTSVASLEQEADTYLLLDVPGARLDATQVEACSNGEVLKELTVAPEGFAGRSLRVPLGQLLDSARHVEESGVLCRVSLRTPPGDQVSFPILFVEPSLQLGQVSLGWKDAGSDVQLDLRWETPSSVRDRVARLWSMTRPWQGPIEVSIPDACQTNHVGLVDKRTLQPGRYRLEVAWNDPWTRGLKKKHRLPADDELCGAFDIGDLPQRLERLRLETADGRGSFDLHAEAVLLLRILGQDASEELHWCSEHVADGALHQILALHRALGAHRGGWGLASGGTIGTADRMKEALGLVRTDTWGAQDLKQLIELVGGVEGLAKDARAVLVSALEGELLTDVSEPLVAGGCKESVICLFERYLQGAIDSGQLIRVVSKNPLLASEVVRAYAKIPDRLRPVVETLEQCFPGVFPAYLVLPGYWVRCQAGWACIESLTDASGTSSPSLNVLEATGFVIDATLRPGYDEVAIRIDTARSRITFRNATESYECTRCGQFASADPETASRRHVCRTVTTPGQHIRRRRGIIEQRQELVFASRRPRGNLLKEDGL